MSVLMTLRVSGDPKAVEAFDHDVLKTVSSRGREFGALHHRFYGSETEVLVVDEWPDEASFQAFFDATPEIRQIMDNAGVMSAPQIDFWRALDVDDAF
jgi:quinol monooxygenase YgiN